MMKYIYLSILLILAAISGFGQATKAIVDTGNGTGTVTWSKDTTYILDGFVFVNPGDSLTIEAGTVIKGKPGQTTDASALIVARGAYIEAVGTRQEPIIFTAEEDDLANPFDIPLDTRGLWGGLIILGNASLNSSPGETAIEGIPTSEVRGLYGAIDTNGDSIPDSFDDADNSGHLSYISIRHGGTDIGAGNEINGMTFGGVGSGTTVDHIEVVFNKDDGFEFFGGTVNTKYLIAAYCGDDSYDYDEGFRGKGQFWVVFQSDSAGSDRGGEHDGGTDPETGTPFATPTIYNATYIGRGQQTNDKRALTFRDNAGGNYVNSIFAEYNKGVDVEILGSSDDSYKQYQDGNLKLENNIFWNVAGNSGESIFTISAAKFSGISAADSTMTVDNAKADFSGYFATANNAVADPLFASLSWINDEMLDPRPSSTGPAYQNLAAYPNDGFFEEVEYKGAFSNSTDFWPTGWTLLDEVGYFPLPSSLTRIDEDLLKEITVYPNPNNGLFTVRIQDARPEPVRIMILDMMGNQVLDQEIRSQNDMFETEVDLTRFAAGMYIMRATQDLKVIAVSRIIKN